MSKFKVEDFITGIKGEHYGISWTGYTPTISKVIEVFKEYETNGFKTDMKVRMVSPKQEGTYLVYSKYFKLVPKIKAVLLIK